MKRALIALVAVGFVVAAISIARANSGAEEPSAKPADVSRELARDLITEQTEQQAEQVLRAQEELRKDVDEFANAQSHTLIITIREERPGTVWVVGKVDGEPACVTPPKDAPTYVEVAPLRADVKLDSKVVPLEAKLLTSGACRASIELFVPQQDGYQITVSAPGHGSIGGVKVGHAIAPQKVTVVV
jgi:hypothetical protein